MRSAADSSNTARIAEISSPAKSTAPSRFGSGLIAILAPAARLASCAYRLSCGTITRATAVDAFPESSRHRTVML